MTQKNCSRCDDELPEPRTDNATYVEAADTMTKETEVHVALVHTDETRQIRDKIVSKRNLTVTQANIAMGRLDDAYLRHTEITDEANAESTVVYDHTDLSLDDFDEREIDENTRPEDDPEAVKTEGRTINREVPHRLLICPDCTKDNDTIIW